MKIEIETIQISYGSIGHYWRVVWYTRPLGWWWHRIVAAISYKLSISKFCVRSMRAYFLGMHYKHINKMVDIYHISKYGIPVW